MLANSALLRRPGQAPQVQGSNEKRHPVEHPPRSKGKAIFPLNKANGANGSVLDDPLVPYKTKSALTSTSNKIYIDIYVRI